MQTLTYRGIARKGQNHIDDGVVYIHSWETGSQELVFDNHDKAQRWAERNGCEYYRN